MTAPPRLPLWLLLVLLALVSTGVSTAGTALVLRLAGVDGTAAAAGMCTGTFGGAVVLTWTLAPTLVAWARRHLGGNTDQPAE